MNLTFGQNLNGKWLMTKEGDTYSYPNNPILEFKNDSMTYYDFDKFYDNSQIEINNGEILTDSKASIKFQLINENRLSMISKGNKKENDSVLTTEYLRLLATKTSLTKGQIENLSFNFNWNGERFKVIFNQELGKPYLKEFFKKDEMKKILLEKIDSTFFVSIYE